MEVEDWVVQGEHSFPTAFPPTLSFIHVNAILYILLIDAGHLLTEVNLSHNTSVEQQHYPCYFCFNQTGCLLKKNLLTDGIFGLC